MNRWDGGSEEGQRNAECQLLNYIPSPVEKLVRETLIEARCASIRVSLGIFLKNMQIVDDFLRHPDELFM